MRICMHTNGRKGLVEVVYNHFGSAKYFTIFDTKNKTIEVVGNDNEHHEHGMCQPVNEIAKYKVDAILTRGMGKRAVKMFNDSKIKVYLLDGYTVTDAVNNFENNKLSELTFDKACSGHDCH